MSEVFKAHGLVGVDLTGKHEVTVATKDTSAEAADWTITFLQEYPESINSGRNSTENMLCVLYRACGKSDAGAFYLGKPDTWSEIATTACRALYFAVRGSQPNIQAALQGCDVVLQKSNNELREEAARASGSLRDSGFISYLVQSATYNLKWNSMVTAPTKAT